MSVESKPFGRIFRPSGEKCGLGRGAGVALPRAKGLEGAVSANGNGRGDEARFSPQGGMIFHVRDGVPLWQGSIASGRASAEAVGEARSGED
jgi:hypothetical protein